MTAPRTREGMLEIVALLPEDEAELLVWIDDAVARKDADDFERLVQAAAIAGRKLPLSLLSESRLHLFRDGWRFGWVAAHLEGEVMPALLSTATEWTTLRVSAFIMFVAARWWVTHRPGEAFPVKLQASVRIFRKYPGLTPDVVGVMGATAALMKDAALAKIWGGDGPGEAEARQANLRRIENFLTKPLEDSLPEREMRGYFGSQPMQRAVPDYGRNEKCRCGSGKKYKRCCLEADQERLQRSSSVAGKTSDELEGEIESVTQEDVMQMTLPRLEEIYVAGLAESVQPLALERLAMGEQFDAVVEAFRELGVPKRLREAWVVAVQHATRAWKREAVLQLIEAGGEEAPPLEEMDCCTRLLLASNEPAEFLAALEAESLALLQSHDSEGLQYLVAGLTWSPYRALGIMVARGALLLTEPEHSEWIFNEIFTKRADLDLPIDDPSADLLDERASSRGAGDADAGLVEAQARLERKAGEVREVREKLAALQRDIALREKREQRAATQAPTATAAPADAVELREMRRKLETLKALLSERGEERVHSRREVEKLQAELAELKAAQEAGGAVTQEESDEPPSEAVEVQGYQPLRKIELPAKVYETLASFPPQVGRAVMPLLGRLGAGEPAAFMGLRKLLECEDVMRARVAGDYRLLLRFTPEEVEVLDVVNRRDLQRRAKSLRAKGA
ncbi:MAG TPA: SEC-C metal-binding domain-containing protein [Chthoniobacterales bacterium]